MKCWQVDQEGNPHLAINVIAADQSCHRVAFGLTTSEGADMTGHALQMVLAHVQHVTKFYAEQGWSV